MCGIVGFVSRNTQAQPVILQGLKNIEYRGYDNSGIAMLDNNGRIGLRRVEGNPKRLAVVLNDLPLTGTIGIGHTRWATHGDQGEQNAHPHVVGEVAVVHNGIIENHAELRRELEEQGCVFTSQTDTEVIPQLINHLMKLGTNALQAVRETVERLTGNFALAILFEKSAALIAVRKGAPLVIGFGKESSSIGSDCLAIARCADRFIRLENGDIAIVHEQGTTIYDLYGKKAERAIRPIPTENISTGKDGYRHFTLKEIYQQPETIGATLRSLIDPRTEEITLPPLPFDLADVSHLSIVACGSSYYAGLIARAWFEELAGISVDCEVASEFLYREKLPVIAGRAAIFISQSGETADSIMALERLRADWIPTIGIVNVHESTIAATADGVIYTQAYPELAVASTKAFTAQLTVLACMAASAARQRDLLTAGEELGLVHAFAKLPTLIQTVLNLEPDIAEIAKNIAQAHDVFYLGRGTNFGVALEGALKLKELAYIHAEGFPGGELKHGPLALIEEGVPVIVIAPPDRWFTKTISNLDEVKTRGGKMILLSDEAGYNDLVGQTWRALALPTIHPMLNPIVYTIAVQLLAYHVALCKGTNIDQPRNLAKCVSVE